MRTLLPVLWLISLLPSIAGARQAPSGTSIISDNIQLLTDRWSSSVLSERAYKADRNRAMRSGRAKLARMKKKVQAYGVRLTYTGDGCFGHPRCEMYSRFEAMFDGTASSQAVLQGWTEAEPKVSQEVAEAGGMAIHASTEEIVKSRFRREQQLRGALIRTHGLTGIALNMYQLAVSLEVSKVDRENTGWVKKLIARQGWPRLADGDQEVAEALWVLTLHARHDPVFRLAALSAMKEASERGLLSKAVFATREDHIFSETTGWQRYGTKGHCSNGTFKIEPVLAEERLVDLRREAELPTLEDQARVMNSACGVDQTLH